MTAKLFVTLLLIFAALSAGLPCAAEDIDSSRARLDKLQKEIRQTLEGLRSKQSESGALSEDLESLTTEVRRIERLARKSDQKLSLLTEQMAGKRRELEEINALRNRTEQQIQKRLVTLYKTGEVGLVKAMLAESENPRDIAEKYAFLSRMVRHDRQLLDEYRTQLENHRAALADLETLQKEQSALVLKRRNEQATLQKARKNKKALLAEVARDAALLEQVLKELRAKAARLNDLVKKLETEQAQPYTEALEGLQPHKGHLLWPVPGQLRVGFGTSRHGELGTLIESHGFDIEAAVGTPVNAAAAGRVIFAKSLRGYGKLMILDHGRKFYTLYAHVARFTKQLGDFVAAAEVIAYSGYEGRDAVYFEIRQGGKPLDPSDWLKPR